MSDYAVSYHLLFINIYTHTYVYMFVYIYIHIQKPCVCVYVLFFFQMLFVEAEKGDHGGKTKYARAQHRRSPEKGPDCPRTLWT